MQRYQAMADSATSVVASIDVAISPWPIYWNQRDETVPRRMADVHDRNEFIAAVQQHTPTLLRVTGSLLGVDHAQDAA